MTTLYDLAMESKFTEVFNRVRSHPEEAKFRNDNNWVTLHILVWKKAPLSSVKAVYKAYPSGLQVRSKRGETALDMAENNKVDEKIISFLKSSEYAQMRDSVLQLSLLQSNFNEIKETCENLVKENDVLKEYTTNLGNQCENLMKETNFLKENTANLGNQCDSLVKENDALKEYTTTLKESTDVLEVSVESLSQDNLSTKELSGILKDNCESLTQENKALMESTDRSREILESEILTLKDEVAMLMDESSLIKKNNDEVKADNEVIKMDWSALRDESDRTKNDIHAIIAANEVLADDSSVLTKESEVLKKTVASLLGTCNYLSQDNEALKDACNEIRRRSDANTFSLKDKLQMIEGTISEIQTELDGSNSQSKKRDLFVSALQTLIHDFDDDILAGGKNVVTPGSPQSTACEL